VAYKVRIGECGGVLSGKWGVGAKCSLYCIGNETGKWGLGFAYGL
jgi:hypothetical protein